MAAAMATDEKEREEEARRRALADRSVGRGRWGARRAARAEARSMCERG